MHSQAHDVGAPPLLEALRTGTGLLHVALEKRMPFFSERLDAQWYRRLLQAYFGFYAPIEAALHDSGLIPEGFDTSLREKTPTLISDLHALGLNDAAISALPRWTDLPTFDTPQPASVPCMCWKARPSEARYCVGRWLNAWAWMPTTVAHFLMYMAPRPDGAGKHFLITWTGRHWTRLTNNVP